MDDYGYLCWRICHSFTCGMRNQGSALRIVRAGSWRPRIRARLASRGASTRGNPHLRASRFGFKPWPRELRLLRIPNGDHGKELFQSSSYSKGHFSIRVAENRRDPAHVRRAVVSRRNRVSLWIFHGPLGYQRQHGLPVAVETAAHRVRPYSWIPALRNIPYPSTRAIPPGVSL